MRILQSLTAGCLACALAWATPASAGERPAPGVFLRSAPAADPAPHILANPVITGMAAQASWAAMAASAGRLDTSYFERTQGLLAIARKRLTLVVDGETPEWAAPEAVDREWADSIQEMGRRFAALAPDAAIAVGAPGLRGAAWPLTGEEDAFGAGAARRQAEVFAAAFPGHPLILYVDFSADPAPELIERLRALAAASRDAAGDRVILVPTQLRGDLEWLDARRTLGKAVRELRVTMPIGAQLAPHAEFSPDSQTGESSSATAPPAPAESAEIRFRRALEYSLWMGASYFEIAESDTEALVFRADLARLRGALGDASRAGAPPAPMP